MHYCVSDIIFSHDLITQLNWSWYGIIPRGNMMCIVYLFFFFRSVLFTLRHRCHTHGVKSSAIYRPIAFVFVQNTARKNQTLSQYCPLDAFTYQHSDWRTSECLYITCNVMWWCSTQLMTDTQKYVHNAEWGKFILSDKGNYYISYRDPCMYGRSIVMHLVEWMVYYYFNHFLFRLFPLKI